MLNPPFSNFNLFCISILCSSDVRHSLDEHFRSNKIGTDSTNSTDGNEEARHETKLGAIQKNIHQNIASSSARNLNENVSQFRET